MGIKVGIDLSLLKFEFGVIDFYIMWLQYMYSMSYSITVMVNFFCFSYTLFRMFDDLILLAKGGLTVYHGSVKKVEEYFAGIGITVPERVNPPDHFIDILEGIVKPSSGVTHQQLPIRWMLHNGYAVPPDMLQLADGIASPAVGSNPSDATDSSAHGGSEQSFAGDLWQDVKFNVRLKHDNIQHNFLRSKDLSNRVTAGVLRQYRYFLGRYHPYPFNSRYNQINSIFFNYHFTRKFYLISNDS